MVELLQRYSKAVLYTSATAVDILSAAIEAAKSGADLRGADLGSAYLVGADLRGAIGLLPRGITPLQISGIIPQYCHLDWDRLHHTETLEGI